MRYGRFDALAAQPILGDDDARPIPAALALPPLRTHQTMRADASRAEDYINKKKPIDSDLTHGVKGTSVLLELSYFDVTRDTLLDMMHLTSGVTGRHLVKLIIGERLKGAMSTEKKKKKKTAAQLQADDEAEEKREAAADKRALATEKRADQALKKRQDAVRLQKGDKQDKAARALLELTDKQQKKQREEAIRMRKEAEKANRVEQSQVSYQLLALVVNGCQWLLIASFRVSCLSLENIGRVW